MKKINTKTSFIGVLIIILLICICYGLYVNQNRNTLNSYSKEAPISQPIENIKLYSDGNDVILHIVDNNQSKVSLKGYFTKSELKNNDSVAKSNKNLTFDFIDSKSHDFISNHPNKQNKINFIVPVDDKYKVKSIYIASNGGNVIIENDSSYGFNSNFNTNGGRNAFLGKKTSLSAEDPILRIETDGGNIIAK